MKKRKPLFLKLFYSYTALISVRIFSLILLVNFSTNDFYNGLIRNELEDRSNNIINWMETIPLSKKSIQNDVVNEVNAESALEYAAETKPNKNNTDTKRPNFPFCVISANKLSPTLLIPCTSAY